MSIYFKTGGVYQPSTRQFIKRGGVWQPAKEVYRKTNGVYTSVFKYDVVPPTRPEIDLRVGGNRYIKVGLRTTGSQPDPQVAMIRVMVTDYSPGPYSQYGVGYVATPDSASGWRNEPFSDWYWNGYVPNSDHGTATNVVQEKYYPPNTNINTNLPGNKYYYFTAWSMDFEGNWSPGTFSKIWMPKDGVQAPRIIYSTATPQAVTSGYLGYGGDDYYDGRPTARWNPRANGIWYHGFGMTNSIGSRGTATVKSATLRVARVDDGGAATANVRVFYHSKNPGETVTSDDMKEPTVLGTINKGEVKWFNLPASWLPRLNTEIRGFGLRAGDQASDFMVATSVAEDIHSGECHVIWEEAY